MVIVHSFLYVYQRVAIYVSTHRQHSIQSLIGDMQMKPMTRQHGHKAICRLSNAFRQLCVYAYTCVYIYIHIYIYTYILKNIYMHTHTHLCWFVLGTYPVSQYFPALNSESSSSRRFSKPSMIINGYTARLCHGKQAGKRSGCWDCHEISGLLAQLSHV